MQSQVATPELELFNLWSNFCILFSPVSICFILIENKRIDFALYAIL